VARVDFFAGTRTVTETPFVRLSRVFPADPLAARCRAAAFSPAAFRFSAALAAGLALGLGVSARAAGDGAIASFHAKVEPLLKKYCYDCHGDGMEKGGVAFDGFASDAALVGKHSLWLAALKNTRAGLMPPLEEGVIRPSSEELATLADWIKYEAFGIDPANPDPGRVTVRRLNRVEYRNTIRDLMGYDFNAEAEFPPDDSGHGFDNLGDALSLSPLHLEKYLSAAETIVEQAVPKVARVMRERVATGRDFKGEGGRNGEQLSARRAATVSRTFKVDRAEKYRLAIDLEVRGSFDFDPGHCTLICRVDGAERFTEDIVWHEKKAIARDYEVDWSAGDHVVSFQIIPLDPVPTPDVSAAPAIGGGRETPGTNPVAAASGTAAGEGAATKTATTAAIAAANAATGTGLGAAATAGPAGLSSASASVGASATAGVAAAAERGARGFERAEAGKSDGEARRRRPEGAAAFTPPPASTRLDVRIASVQVKGPLNPEFWIAPENYARFFPGGPAPADAAGRDRYAREVLRSFAQRAYRRPVDEAKIDQLVGLARRVYGDPAHTFEEGIGRAMMAVLASPRFIFRVEQAEPIQSSAERPADAAAKPAAAAGAAARDIAAIDEYALASRLSYFLWSTMPDAELFGLAERGELRRELRSQVARMLKDAKAQAFVRNFTGQWLQARDIEFVPINARVVFGGNAPAAVRNKDGRVELDAALRKAMRSETEMYFDHIVREDRSVLELVDSDYTFLNEKLAGLYGVPEVKGDNLRLVPLPPGSPRGGVLTQATVLAVTSNPTRTSPVKRGLFVLENILGTPPPPPPPNVPDLEEAKKEFKGREPKLSEMLALHRASPLCTSCHQRMDPLGLALENFNALGYWRDTEARQPIEPAGQLITGEKFADVRELKKVLVTQRRTDIYRCLTEKLLTYALGRGVEYYDAHTVDEIVAALERDGGRMSTLLFGVIESAPFQKTRLQAPAGKLAAGEE
jgi:hypothetical protein